MRNPLNKRFPKEFKANAGRYLCILALLIITIVIGSGFGIVLDSTVATLDEVEVSHKLEDGHFESVDKISDDVYAKLAGEGINVYENFYVTDNEFGESAKVFVFNEREEINTPSVHKGRLPDNDSANEVAVDFVFANQNKIKINDVIDINGSELTVVGLIALPDYNALFLNNADMVMNTSGFGVLVASSKTYDSLNHNLEKYRYSYRFEDRDMSSKEIADATKTLQTILVSNGVELQDLLPAESNQSISYLKNDMGHDGPMVNIFVYVLVGIIAFIFAVLTSSTIEQEAPIIGTLRALGYKKSEIIWHYLVPTLVIAVLGSAIGNAIGYTVMIEPFKRLYYTSYSLPPLVIKFNMLAFIKTTIIPVIIMIVINFIMLADKLSLTPLKFLRKDLKKKHQKRAVKLPEFKFLTRFRLRVILQNKGSYLILFLGIFLSSFLLMFGLGLGPLMDHYVDAIDDNLTYEYMYVLKAPVEADGEKIYMTSLDTEFYLTHKDIGVTFYGIDTSNTTHFDTSKAADNVIAITDTFAKKCRIDVGDNVTFRDSNTDKEYTFKVGAINDYTNDLGVYMDINDMANSFELEQGEFNAYVSDEKLDIEDIYIAKYMTRSDLLGAASQMMTSFRELIAMLNVFAIFAYLVFMYLLTKIVIDKNSLYISFMKVFGYDKKEIRKLYLDASAIVVIVSLFICLPIEVMVFKFALIYLSSLIEGYMEFYLPMYVYAEIVIIGIISYFVINFLHMRKVKKISMSEALKNRD